MSDDKKPAKSQNWIFGKLEDKLIFISVLLIFFAFCAPSFFINTSNIQFDARTGQIGDTIGGTMNPYIALAGVLVTFLAFYIQYKANKEQRELFDDGLKENRKLFEESLQAEKNKELRKEKLDSYHYLCLLQSILGLIINDLEKKIKIIESYYYRHQNTKKYKIFVDVIPFFLDKLPTKNYLDRQDIDRLALYKGFKILLDSREKWLEEYIDLYDTLISLKEVDEMIKNIYQINDLRLKSILEKNKVVEKQIEYFIEASKAVNVFFPEVYDNISKIIDSILEEHRMMPLISETSERIYAIYNYLTNTEFSQDRHVYEMILTGKNLLCTLTELETYTYSFASEIALRCSEITGDDGYLTKLKRSKLILDEELAKIDIEKL